MEIIHAPEQSYFILQQLGQTYKCRAFLGRDNSKRLYVLNQIEDRKRIVQIITDFAASLPDFIEGFVYGESYYIVFPYYEGEHFCQKRGLLAVDALALCESVCFAALAENIPSPVFCQLLFPNCITVWQGEIRFNKIFAFTENDCSEQQAAQLLARELVAYIDEQSLPFMDKLSLEPFLKKLHRAYFTDLLSLYWVVRDFHATYTPLEMEQVMKENLAKTNAFVGNILSKVFFFGAIGAALLVSVLTLVYAFAKPNAGEMQIQQVGGYLINERGHIHDRE